MSYESVPLVEKMLNDMEETNENLESLEKDMETLTKQNGELQSKVDTLEQDKVKLFDENKRVME